MMNNASLWSVVLGELELSLSKASFTTWLQKTFIVAQKENVIIVGVPNEFTKKWLANKYHKDIATILRKLLDNVFINVTYEVVTNSNKQSISINTIPTANPSAVQKPSKPKDVPSPISRTAAQSNQTNTVSSLNSRYTFKNFVVGKGNELAKAACQAVAKNPGLSYNPLFIYGGVGLGKTHLMQAIGNDIYASSKDAIILYVTCEKFTNDFIKAVQEGKAGQFKDTYRSVDVLMIDDIQFLAGKEGTQEEFFHTFNALHQINKQIVISSDRPPKAIPNLENRLTSRFEWGMIADVSSPDLETRIAILDAKCKEKGLMLDKEIIHYIANVIQSNIRELEGALNKLIAHIEFTRTALTIERAKNILYTLTSARSKNALTSKQLVQHVARFYDITIEDITGNSRKKELVVPRQIAIYLMREEIKSSYPTIGEELGGRDHTTAMHAYTKIRREIDLDEKIRQDIEAIRQLLYS